MRLLEVLVDMVQQEETKLLVTGMLLCKNNYLTLSQTLH